MEGEGEIDEMDTSKRRNDWWTKKWCRNEMMYL